MKLKELENEEREKLKRHIRKVDKFIRDNNVEVEYNGKGEPRGDWGRWRMWAYDNIEGNDRGKDSLAPLPALGDLIRQMANLMMMTAAELSPGWIFLRWLIIGWLMNNYDPRPEYKFLMEPRLKNIHGNDVVLYIED